MFFVPDSFLQEPETDTKTIYKEKIEIPKEKGPEEKGPANFEDIKTTEEFESMLKQFLEEKDRDKKDKD